MRGNGTIYRQKGSRFWWLQYYRAGKPLRESSGTIDERVARSILKQKLAEVALGFNSSAGDRGAAKLVMRDLAEDLLLDYSLHGRSSRSTVQGRWNNHLEPVFGGLRAIQVDNAIVTRYMAQRQAEGAPNASINRELAALKRMFKLAVQAKKIGLGAVPYIPLLEENNVRRGFVKDEDYERLAAETGNIGLWLRTVFELGYTYGWRREELLPMLVTQVDLGERAVLLHAGETKNDEARMVIMTEKVFELLSLCVEGKLPGDYVFTRERDGRGRRLPPNSPVRDMRDDWHRACCAAGLGAMVCPKCKGEVVGHSEMLPASPAARGVFGAKLGKAVSSGMRGMRACACGNRLRADNSSGICWGCQLGPRAGVERWKCVAPECGKGCVHNFGELKYSGLLFHDLRRSGVRNMRRNGIDERVAMKISGHKTHAVFQRYNIVDGRDLRDAADKMEAASRRQQENSSQFSVLSSQQGNLFDADHIADHEIPRKPAQNEHRTGIDEAAGGRKPN